MTDPLVIDLDQSLDGGWRPGSATVVATARTTSGDVVTRRNETFRWTPVYPNGKDCDPKPYLQHTVHLTSTR